MKTIIIGAVAAGAKAAMKLRRLMPDSEITIYTNDTHISYSSCGIPYYIKGDFDDYRELFAKTPEEFENVGINVFLQHKVVKIQPEYNNILVNDIIGEKSFLAEYDNLIIATGARPFVPHIKNINLSKVFSVRSIEDAINIKEALKSAKRAVIVGSGYIGIEMLEAFVSNNVYVDVIEMSETILPYLDSDMSKLIQKELECIADGRFEFHTGKLVSELRGDCDGVKEVITQFGEAYRADLVILATGVIPNVELAIDAGIELGSTGAIKIDKFMRTNFNNVYACGDCAQKMLMISDEPVYIPLGSYASKEGRAVAINISGQNEEYAGILGSTVTKCLDLTISMTGMTETHAIKSGFDAVSYTLTKCDRVGYMPDAENITLKMVADKKSGQILGAQAFGSKYADKKINSLTSALAGKMTVKDFLNNDATYAPPYSTSVDLLYNAALGLLNKIDV